MVCLLNYLPAIGYGFEILCHQETIPLEKFTDEYAGLNFGRRQEDMLFMYRCSVTICHVFV